MPSGARVGPRNDRTSPQPLVLFCFGLFWSTRRTNAFCSALPPGYTEVVQESRGGGGAAAGQGSGGRLGPAPHRPGLAGRRRPVGGDQAKIRGLSDKICSAGGRSLAICAPSAQSARRWHRRTSACLRKHALRTLYVPRLGSSLFSTPAASSGFPADEHDQPADAAFCTCNAR